MAVARVTKITAASAQSFDAAIHEGLRRANKTVRGINGIQVIDQNEKVANGNKNEYRVTMEIRFVLEG